MSIITYASSKGVNEICLTFPSDTAVQGLGLFLGGHSSASLYPPVLLFEKKCLLGILIKSSSMKVPFKNKRKIQLPSPHEATRWLPLKKH